MSMDISNVMKYIYLLIVVTKLAIFPQQHLRQEGDASLLDPAQKMYKIFQKCSIKRTVSREKISLLVHRGVSISCIKGSRTGFTFF